MTANLFYYFFTNKFIIHFPFFHNKKMSAIIAWLRSLCAINPPTRNRRSFSPPRNTDGDFSTSFADPYSPGQTASDMLPESRAAGGSPSGSHAAGGSSYRNRAARGSPSGNRAAGGSVSRNSASRSPVSGSPSVRGSVSEKLSSGL